MRHVVDQRQHVHREVGLHRRVLVEQVEHDLRVRVALQLDDEARRVAGRLVADVADALDLAVVDQLGDLVADHLDRGLVRHLRHGDAHVALAALFDLGDRAHLDGATTGRVGVVDPAAAEDQGAGREVGALHELHEVGDGRVGVLEQVLHRVDHLPEVVRRDVRRHTDGDPASSVDQEVGKSRGEHDRLDGVAVVGGREVDRVLVDLTQQLHRERCQPRLGVVVDEAGGEEGVVIGIDPDREHGLHAGTGHRLDGGEVPAARDEWGDDLLHLRRRDVAQDLVSSTFPVGGAVEAVLLEPLLVDAPRIALGPHVVGEERDAVDVVGRQDRGQGVEDLLELLLLGTPEPDATREEVGVATVADHQLDLTVGVFGTT